MQDGEGLSSASRHQLQQLLKRVQTKKHDPIELRLATSACHEPFFCEILAEINKIPNVNIVNFGISGSSSRLSIAIDTRCWDEGIYIGGKGLQLYPPDKPPRDMLEGIAASTAAAPYDMPISDLPTYALDKLFDGTTTAYTSRSSKASKSK